MAVQQVRDSAGADAVALMIEVGGDLADPAGPARRADLAVGAPDFTAAEVNTKMM
jgi:hypothetical protein